MHQRPAVRVGHHGGVALEQHGDAQLGGGAPGGGDPVGADLARDPGELPRVRGEHRGSPGQRPRILGELALAQQRHLGDALDRGRVHVGRELLVAEDRQPFLEGELEPVAAGDAVARPVMEIFVRDDPLDRAGSRRRSRCRTAPAWPRC